MKSLQKHIGDLGEDLASRYLKSKDFIVLERNFIKFSSGAEKSEIDIIAKKADIFHFVEVKTISKVADNYRDSFLSPFDKVNVLKREKIVKAAEYWMNKNKFDLNIKYQIDVIAVKISNGFKNAKIKMIENI